MSSAGAKSRSPWPDRFREPTVEYLIEFLRRQNLPAFNQARTKLLALDGMHETIAWQGVWNWTIGYRMAGQSGSACAYLIPDPDKPRLCVPIAEHRLADLPTRKLSKIVREAILHAPAVNGDRWPVWAIQSKAQIDELLLLVEVRPVVEVRVASATALT